MTAASKNISRSTLLQYTPAISTGVDCGWVTSDLLHGFKEGWRKIVDAHLIEWGRYAKSGTSLDDEIVGPSLKSLESFGNFIGDGLFPVASRVTPNGDGGICAEWQYGDHLMKMEFTEDGSIRFVAFHGAVMVEHMGY